MSEVNTEFYPSINGFSLRKYKIVENSMGNKRVKGNIYVDDTKVGTYDPLFVKDGAPTISLKIYKKYEGLWEDNSLYSSMFDYGVDIDDELHVNKVGLGVILSDLEFLTIMYDAMQTFNRNHIEDGKKPVGLINNNNFKMIYLTEMQWNKGRHSCLEFIRKNIPQIMLDNDYPTLLFRTEDDFIFNNIITIN